MLNMAHNLAPSVNCSLDDIDLNALKVSTPPRPSVCRQCSNVASFWRQTCVTLSITFLLIEKKFRLVPGSGGHIRTHRSRRQRHLWTSVQGKWSPSTCYYTYLSLYARWSVVRHHSVPDTPVNFWLAQTRPVFMPIDVWFIFSPHSIVFDKIPDLDEYIDCTFEQRRVSVSHM